MNSLKSFTKCSVCNKSYGQMSPLLLEENENGATFHISCDNCESSILVFVSDNNEGFSSLGMATDMSRSEVKKFFKKDSVTADDVVRVHECLKSIKGGVDNLI